MDQTPFTHEQTPENVFSLSGFFSYLQRGKKGSSTPELSAAELQGFPFRTRVKSWFNHLRVGGAKRPYQWNADNRIHHGNKSERWSLFSEEREKMLTESKFDWKDKKKCLVLISRLI